MLDEKDCKKKLSNLAEIIFSDKFRAILNNSMKEKKRTDLIKMINDDLKCFENLIKEHFKKENTPDFKHFNLYSNTTLKQMKKDELIEYIHILYSNWKATDWYYNNVVNLIRENEEHLFYKFEELYDCMAYHDNFLGADALINQVYDKDHIYILWYAKENSFDHGVDEDCVKYDEKRFAPVKKIYKR